MMAAMDARVVIVGGGVMGARIAWACAKHPALAGGRVVLLERRALAAGSSGRSGAVLRQHYSDPEVAAMARDSLREFAGLEAATGKSISFRACGVLTLAGPRTPTMQQRVRDNVRMQRGLGIDTRLIEAAQIEALIPGAAVAQGTIAAYEPGGGFCDPLRAVNAFAELASEAGANLRIGCELIDIVIEDRRVRAVVTSQGRIETECVVLAAGPWTSRVLARAGLALPLSVVRPQQHFVDTSVDHSVALPREGEAAHPVLLDLELGYYTRCEPPRRRTRIGALEHDRDDRVEDPDLLDESVDPEFMRWARGRLVERLPRYADRADQAPQAAWYTLTPDSQPILGPLDGPDHVRGLFVAAGFSGHGFKLSPSVGEGLAQCVFGEPVRAFDPRFFGAQRFRDGRGANPAAFGL